MSKAKQPIDTGSWSSDFEQLLLNATEYSGSTKAGDKVLSASSIGKELYYNILQVKHGKQDNKQEKYGANTVGSIYQHGLDKIIEEFGEPGRYKYAVRYKKDLGNGWVVSGEYDILDTKYKIIIDGKVLSSSSFSKAKKNLINDDYNLQVATYRWFVEDETGEPHTGGLHMVNKSGSPAKDTLMKNMELYMHEPEYIQNLFLKRSEDIQQHLDAGTMPTETHEMCDQNAYGKENGVFRRCFQYCDYKNVCPRINENISHHISQQVRNINTEKEEIKPEYKPQQKLKF